MSFTTLSFLLLFLPAYLLAVISFRGKLRQSIVCVLSALFLLGLSTAVFFGCLLMTLAAYLFGRYGRLPQMGTAAVLCVAGGAVLIKSLAGTAAAAHIPAASAAVANVGVLCALSVCAMLNCSYLAELSHGAGAEQHLLSYFSYAFSLPLLFTGPSMNYEEYQVLRTEPKKKDILAGLAYVIKGTVKSVAVGFGCLQAFSGIIGFVPEGLDLLTFLLAVLFCCFGVWYLLYGIGDVAMGLGRLQGMLLIHPFDRPSVFAGFSEAARSFNRSTALFVRRYVAPGFQLNDTQTGVACILFVGLQYFSTPAVLLWSLLVGALYLLEQALPAVPENLRAVRAAYTMPVFMFTFLFFGLFYLIDIGGLLSAVSLQGFQFASSKTLFTVTQYIMPLLLGIVGLIPKFSLKTRHRHDTPVAKAYRAVGWTVLLLLFVYSLFNLLGSDTNPFFVLWKGVA